MTAPKKRADLKFESLNLPEPVALECDSPITDADLEIMKNAMPVEALEDEGLLVSGERW